MNGKITGEVTVLEKLNLYVEKHRQLILDSLDYIWKNPETGYREVKTNKYMEEVFESLGYELVCLSAGIFSGLGHELVRLGLSIGHAALSRGICLGGCRAAHGGYLLLGALEAQRVFFLVFLCCKILKKIQLLERLFFIKTAFRYNMAGNTWIIRLQTFYRKGSSWNR